MIKSFLNKNIFFLFLLFFATSFSILYQGYYYGQNDTSIYVPYLKSLSNKSLYPDDLMINTWKSVYPANLWKLLAFLSQIFPLEKLLLCLHILFRFFFFLILYILSFEIFRNKKLAYLSLVLWFIPKPTLGFDIFYNEFVQSSVALPILLSSILFFVKSRYVISALLLGTSFHIHPPISGFIFVSIIFYLFYRRKFIQIAQFSSITLLIAFPIILSTFLLAKHTGGYDKEWLLLTRIRSANHSFPLSWPKETWWQFILFTSSFLISLKYSFRELSHKTKKLLFLVFPLSLILLTGFIFSEVIPVPKFIIIVPFHISSIFSVVASFPIIYSIYKLAHDKKLVSKFLGYASFFLFFFNDFLLRFSKAQIIVLGISLFFILIHKLFSRAITKVYSYKPHFIIFLVTLILWIPFMIKNNFMRFDPYQYAWQTVQKWSFSHTARNDLFIVPIYLSGFRVYSERPVFADWKDGSIGYLSPQYLKDWWHRMEEFGLNKQNYNDNYQKKSYNNLSKEKINYLAKKYNAHYFISEKVRVYDFPKEFSNQYFIVYKLTH